MPIVQVKEALELLDMPMTDRCCEAWWRLPLKLSITDSITNVVLSITCKYYTFRGSYNAKKTSEKHLYMILFNISVAVIILKFVIGSSQMQFLLWADWLI